MKSISVTLKKSSEIDAKVLEELRSVYQRSGQHFTPFLSPDFFVCTGSVLDQSEIAILSVDESIVGYFFYERVHGTSAIPCGRILSDYQGVVSIAGVCWSADDLLRQLRLQRYNFDHLVEPENSNFRGIRETDRSPIAELQNGFDAYWHALECNGSRLPSECRAKFRRLQRAFGSVEIVETHECEFAFRTLLAWKSAQYKSTGVADVFELDWPERMLRVLLASQTSHFAGTMTSLMSGDRILASVIGLQTPHTWHWWFPAYAPELSSFSPGTLLLAKKLESLANRGIREADFGRGVSTFKERFATGFRTVGEGSHVRPFMAARLALSRWLRRHFRRGRGLK